MKNNVNRQIKSGAVISYFAIAISIISALLYTPWMKNQIGDANYGLYTLITSLISIFLMDFGLGTSVTRFVAKYRAENKEKLIADVLGCVLKLYLAIDIIIFIALTVVYFNLEKVYTGLSMEEIQVLKSVFLIFGTYSILAFPFTPLSGILNAYELFIEMKLCDLFQKLLAIGLIIIVLLSGHGLTYLVAMNALAGVISIIIKIWFVKTKVKIKPNFKVRDFILLKAILNFSIWVTVMAISQRMIFNIAPSILGMVSNSLEIARFAPASQMEGYFFTFAYAINGLFLPLLSRYDSKSNDTAILNLAEKVGRYQMGILGLLYTGIVVLGTQFMGLWMGSDYKICGLCTVMMITPSLFQYPQQIFNTMLSVRNLIKYQALAAVVMGLTNIILSFVFIPQMGALGSSLSIMISYTINFVLLNIIYHKKLRLNLKKFYVQVFVRYIPIILFSILISKGILTNIKFSGWSSFFIGTMITGIIYLCILLVFGISKIERQMILAKIRKKRT